MIKVLFEWLVRGSVDCLERARNSRSGMIDGRPSPGGYSTAKSWLRSTSAALAISRSVAADDPPARASRSTYENSDPDHSSSRGIPIPNSRQESES
jgi:hypothetical protein